jgi:glycolate oxidase FAD binding subunit
MLPLDPPLPERTTVGGLIATAADGPRRLGYGTLRDLLIGITVVEADGRVSRGGGMVVKNVSGFDMMKLYLGSFGTLAVVASANFKLLPAPRATGSLLCRFAAPAQAFAAVEALHLTQLTPTAVEYLSPRALAGLAAGSAEISEEGALGTQTGSGGRPRAASSSVDREVCGLLVRAEGLPQAVARHLADIAAIAWRCGALETEELAGTSEAATWARAADLAHHEALVKLAVLPGDVERAAARVEELGARHGATAALTARALSGVAYARLSELDSPRLAAILEEIPGLQWVATDLPGTPRWGPAPQGVEVMQRIKQEFDPHNRLNPGRFVEAIERSL